MLSRFEKLSLGLQSVIVGLIAMVVSYLSGGKHDTEANNYVYLAQAFLEGHTWIHWPGPRIDALPWHGLYYVIEAPVPAILLLPFVKIWGLHVNQSLLGVVCIGVALGAAWDILSKLGVNVAARVWLSIFLFTGTDLWWCSTLGGVWFIAHLGAVAFTMLALREIFGNERGWLVAFFGCLAAGCRFSSILALPVYAIFLAGKINFRQGLIYSIKILFKTLSPFIGVTIGGLILWLCYNEARWHVPNDIGYNEWYKYDPFGSGGAGPFQLRFLPYEFSSFFLALPRHIHHWPWIVAPITGQSLIFTSPALLLAFFAKGDRLKIYGLWVVTLLIAAPSFIYYANGFEQFGMRHALDFEPFLLVLMGLACLNNTPLWGRILISYSVLIGCWGVLAWHMHPRWV
jgi:hypothetical protein